MTHDLDSVVGFDQLLWDLQPHSTSVSTSPTSRKQLPTSDDHPSRESLPTTFNLNELEQRALLDVLNEYKEPLETSTNHFGSLQALCAVDKRPVDKSADAAFKLAVKRAKATKRRNRHRERVKAEWQTLRLQNTQLSVQLVALKNSRVHGVGNVHWQAMASKELTARLQVEGEQRNLRLAIEHRAAVMQNLLESWRQFASSTNKSVPKHEWLPGDFEMYENFMLEMDAAYARTDEMLHQSGLAEPTPTNTNYYVPKRKWDTMRGITFFESTTAFVLPSRYPKTADVMFESIRHVFRQNPSGGLHEAVDDPKNTIAVKSMTAFFCESGEMVPFSLVIVIRRYVEPNRTVLVWRGLFQSDGKYAGIYFNNTGWTVLRAASTGTDVRTCEHNVPMFLNPTETITAPEMNKYAEFMMRSAQPHTLTLAQQMEQMLLEDRQTVNV